MNKEQQLEMVVHEVVYTLDVENKTDTIMGVDGRPIKLFGFDKLAVYLGLPRGETIEMFDSWTESYAPEVWRDYVVGLIYNFFDQD